MQTARPVIVAPIFGAAGNPALRHLPVTGIRISTPARSRQSLPDRFRLCGPRASAEATLHLPLHE
ncbi:hypothetical protein [Chlorobium sp. N1]|uniref:hypothetical protein n=1 Tax=Chlorobium sp. N1 TaxID=2491138 RepID=UPI0013F16B4E|nr:hypothetical protein [Chlorobium sp. N1]